MKQFVLVSLLLTLVVTFNNIELFGGRQRLQRPTVGKKDPQAGSISVEDSDKQKSMNIKWWRALIGGGLILLSMKDKMIDSSTLLDALGLTIALWPFGEEDKEKRGRIWRVILGGSLLAFGINSYAFPKVSFPSVVAGGCIALWPWLKDRLNNLDKWVYKSMIGEGAKKASEEISE
jgi:hypothetical protein